MWLEERFGLRCPLSLADVGEDNLDCCQDSAGRGCDELEGGGQGEVAHEPDTADQDQDAPVTGIHPLDLTDLNVQSKSKL